MLYLNFGSLSWFTTGFRRKCWTITFLYGQFNSSSPCQPTSIKRKYWYSTYSTDDVIAKPIYRTCRGHSNIGLVSQLYVKERAEHGDQTSISNIYPILNKLYKTDMKDRWSHNLTLVKQTNTVSLGHPENSYIFQVCPFASLYSIV